MKSLKKTQAELSEYSKTVADSAAVMSAAGIARNLRLVEYNVKVVEEDIVECTARLERLMNTRTALQAKRDGFTQALGRR